MTKTTGLRLLLATLLCFTAVFASAQEATANKAGQVLTLTEASKIATSWRPDVQLYVKGNVGLDQAQLQDIAAWLTNYPQWSILLCADATNEIYQDPSGRTRTGYDAVDYAVGVGLFNSPTFAARQDQQTGLKNRSFFTICFSPRKITAYTSELLERYGLSDEITWQGNFDREAMYPLQHGRRIGDAIKAVVKRYEQELSQKEEEAVRRFSQTKNAATAVIADAENLLETLTTRVKSFKQQNSALTGDLVNPNLEELKSGLQNARDALTKNNFEEVTRQADPVKTRCSRLLAAIDTWSQDSQKLNDVSESLSSLQAHVFAKNVESEIKTASAMIAEAQALYQRGDSAYVSKLKAATATVDQGWAAATRAQKAEQIKHNLIVTCCSAIGLLLVICLILLALGSHKARKNALAIVTRWKEAFSEKFDQALKLDERKRSVLGATPSDVIFEGRTGDLAKHAIKDIGDLLIMWSCVYKTLDQAQELISPKAFWPWLISRFRTRPFKRAIALLQDTPIEFDPEDGLEIVINGKSRNSEEMLWAPLGFFAPFSLSFGNLVAAFNKKAKLAFDTLENIENAVLHIADRIATLETQITAIQARRGDFLRFFEHDASLLDQFWGEPVSALTAKLEQCRQSSYLNPVESEELASELEKSLAVIADLLHRTLTSLQEATPKIERAIAELEALGRQTSWIKNSLTSKANEAMALIGKLAQEGISAEFNQDALSAKYDFGLVLNDVEFALALVQQLITSIMPEVTALEKQIAAAKTALAKTLGKQENQVLLEENANPSKLSTEVKAQIESAWLAIDAGDKNTVKATVDNIVAQNGQIAAILQNSQEAVSFYAEHYEQLRQLHTEAKLSLPKYGELLKSLQTSYLSEALLLSAGDKTHPRANDSVLDNIAKADEGLNNCLSYIEQAQVSYQAANVLASRQFLVQAEEHYRYATARLQEIDEKKERLLATIKTNQGGETHLDGALRSLEEEAKDRLVCESTVNRLKEANAAFALAQKEARLTPSDPFAIADKYDALTKTLEELRAQMARDRSSYNQLKSLLQRTNTQLETLKAELNDARTDELPDAPELSTIEGETTTCERRFLALQQDSQRDHVDWHRMETLVETQFSAIATLRSRLSKSQEEAQSAMDALKAAQQRVREARNWSGRYGVSISGNYGRGALEEAQSSFTSGDFAMMILLANQAQEEAAHAISDAENAVADAQREEEARLEREREERRREEQSSFSSASSFGSGSDSSFSSFDSGGSSSSFSDSSSGGSSSSW